MSRRASPFDPVTLEVGWNRLIGVVNEQAAALLRTSFSSVVREAGDLSAGIFDRRGRMVAQAVTGTPGHINSMALAVRHFLDAHPVDTLAAGDVLITNDPWKTSGHLYDVTICTPVFRQGECVALFASTCHMVDIGGRIYSAQARDAYEEGLCIPIVKLHEAGRANETLLRLVRANTRMPDLVLGDIHAQMVGGDVGGQRLLEFMDEFGLARLEDLADEIIGRTERAMREAIRRLRPGPCEYAITSDGFDEPITLRARVEARGDELHVDYAGSSPESRHGINVVLNYTLAYTTYGVKAVLSPEVPNNDGVFHALRITAPEGSILNARHPAPVAARAVIGHFLPHVVSGALSQAIPDRVMAEGSANIWILHVTGKDMAGRPFVLHVVNSGGTGARATKDGLSATAFPSGVLATPVEVMESIAPVVVERKSLRPGSGGAGRYRGGLGQTIVFGVRTREPWTCAVLSDRTRVPAQGLQGGRPGAPGEVWIDGARPANAKAEHVLSPDARVEIRLPGGGGYGDPATRDPELSRRDLALGAASGPGERARPGDIRIVSGGQTGADRAALDWAMARGWEHGGWCPRGRKAEDGPIAPRYRLRETPSEDYVQRTEWNVRDSDGTVILSLSATLTGGSRKTAELAQQHGKPWVHLSRERDREEAAERLCRFVGEHRIRVLNVAGPRASSERGVGDFVRRTLEEAFPDSGPG